MTDIDMKIMDRRPMYCKECGGKLFYQNSGIYQCEDCGAEFVLSNNETSTSCPFCGRVHVLERGEIPGIRP